MGPPPRAAGSAKSAITAGSQRPHLGRAGRRGKRKVEVGQVQPAPGAEGPPPRGASAAQGSAITAPAARSPARGWRDAAPRKVGAVRARRPPGRSPPAWGRSPGGEPGRPNQVGTRGQASASRAHSGLARAPGAPGPGRGRGTARPGTHLPPCRRRRGCLSALRTRRPGRGSARLPASSSPACSSPAPAAAALPTPNLPPEGPPPRAAGGRQSHPLTSGGSRARPSPFPSLCAAPIPPRPLSPSPHPFRVPPFPPPRRTKFGLEAAGFPARAPGSPRPPRRLAAPRRGRGAK